MMPAALVHRSLGVVAASLTVLSATAAEPPDPKALIVAEQRAMALLAGFDGTWRGPAVTTVGGGRKLSLTQTERVGPFLDGSIRVIEGRGYRDDGALLFNAFGTISFSPQDGRYHFRAIAQGYAADPTIEVTQDRFVWSLPAGPGAVVRYTATVRDGVWTEIGERIVDGQPPVRTHEMTLTRIGDSDWPAAGAVPLR